MTTTMMMMMTTMMSKTAGVTLAFISRDLSYNFVLLLYCSFIFTICNV